MTSLNSQLDINALVEMGFPKERIEHAVKALKNPSDIQSVVEWLFNHPVLDNESGGHRLGDASSESNTNEEPVSSESEGGAAAANTEDTETSSSGEGAAGGTALSLKCEDCGKQLREVDVQAHAARTGHQNFAESTEAIKPLTAEEKEEKRRKLVEKMEERRKDREMADKEQDKAREMTRRKTGQEVTQAREEQAYKEMKRIAEERRKEKMEEKLLKQKLRDEIAKDRAQFKKQQMSDNTTAKEDATKKGASSSVESTASKTEVNKSARIQFRLPDGSTQNSNFDSTSTLQVLYDFIGEKMGDGTLFDLCLTFPRKVFGVGDLNKTLKELGLVPSASLVLVKK